MSVVRDLVARTAALTAIDRSLLVEAGAGSGKTSVMAGRVAVLFASGVEPKHIAAITFTEFAASELRLRIEGFATTLSKGEVPRDLEHLLPDGITPEQKAKVERACKALDQLACTTIHGFAQALLKPYPASLCKNASPALIPAIRFSCDLREDRMRRFAIWPSLGLVGSIPKQPADPRIIPRSC